MSPRAAAPAKKRASPAKRAVAAAAPAPRTRRGAIEIPREGDAELVIGGRAVRLTNLDKPFWKREGITKGDLLRYYAGVAPALLPHLRDRALRGTRALLRRRGGSRAHARS